jgi:flagellar hook assembly protein FlgD
MELDKVKSPESTGTEPRTALDKSGLGRDAFLKIFLAQLENQDPLQPQDTSELSAQLAQFSQLEQSLAMAEELRGVNERLDRLLEQSGGGSGSALQPVSLIGREVEIDGNVLGLSGTGGSSPLRFELEDEASVLQIDALSESGARLALLQLAPGRDAEGRALTLPTGGYGLAFQDGQAVLELPGGRTLPVELVQVEERDGRWAPVVDDQGETIPYAFQPGASYQFLVGGSAADGDPLEVSTTTTGRVDSVRNDPDGATVTVGGREVALSQIIRIR